MANSNSSEAFHDREVQDLGFVGPDRYDLVRILGGGGPSSDRDSYLLEEYERRDALAQKWYYEDKAAGMRRNLTALVVLGALLIAASFLLPYLF
ncbi:hypothetical protein [Rhodococcus erythropolis]|uniref:hypothetical protein n=1 Tax=Rhodococcus erythropolis TaxID=1833 RepID=UPI001BEB4756|nr:hypothetical protein [Rhodococcus erythropolis]MBT2269077.1 hypothetical protein [Rhodococcus erythropolis]